MVVDPQTGKARIEFQVEEGLQYLIASFSVEGNQEFADTLLYRYFEPEQGGLLAGLGIGGGSPREQTGRVFDQVVFEAAAGQVQELYANEGFLYAQVQSQVLRNPVVPGEPPTVDVSWQISEGLPAYIRRVAVMGNDYTYDRVVRDRVFLLPGDRYSQERASSRATRTSASWGSSRRPCRLPTSGRTPVTGDVDVMFEVKEKQTGSVNFGTSVGGGGGLAGFIGYDQPNLFGQAKSGRLRWDFGRYLNSAQLSFSDPSLFQSLVSGTINLFNSHDRFFQFATGRRRRVGASLNIGFPVPGALRTRAFTGYSIARTKYQLFTDVEDTSLFGLPPGTQSTLLLGITRNTVDHPIFPTAGSRLSWNWEVNGGVLGGDGNFNKHTFEGAWWVPVGQLGGGGPGGATGPRFALGLTLRAGAILGDASRFPFDRFFMGGVQFGQQLRGYDETAITPLGSFAERAAGIQDGQRVGDAFLSLTAEYALRVSDVASISTFFDAGNVWLDPQEIDPTRLFRGAGVGVQLVTPVGPLGLDYAYGFDKPNPGWQFHFKHGTRPGRMGYDLDWSVDMKRIVMVATAFLLVLPGVAAAQMGEIRYINSQDILAEAPGAKEAQAQFEQDMQGYQAEVQQMATELDNLVNQYETQQAMLSPSAKQQREADIRAKQQAYQQELAAIDERAGQRQQELVQPVMDRINQVIEQIRAEGSYAIIFDVAGGGVVAADSALDLTQEVIRRLQASGETAGATGRN